VGEEGLVLLPGPHASLPLSMQLEQRGRLQKSVAKEVSGQSTLCEVRGNWWPHLGWWAYDPEGTQAVGSLLWTLGQVRSG
jgi:hypothetical protein